MVVVHALDDAISKATVHGLLCHNRLVEHEDLRGAPLAEVLNEGVGGTTLGRLERPHERCAELSLGRAVEEIKEAACSKTNAD